MDEIKMSKLLTQLLEDAKHVDGKEDAPLTAERFFVAAINMISRPSHLGGEEINFVARKLKVLVKDMEAAKAYLLKYLSEERSMAFLEPVYMKKKLQEASLEAESKNWELDTVTLLSCIAKEPSDALRPILTEEPPEKKDRTERRVDQASRRALREQIRRMYERMEAEDEETPEEAPRQEIPDAERFSAAKGEIDNLVREVKVLRKQLLDVVYGQDNAVNVFVTGYFQSSMLSMLDRSRKRPRATFLFAGPPGVGKTFLAESAAEALNLPFRRFDMSEYADKEANIEFCGSDKVYKNGKEGNVTGFVDRNPRCVLLFDEIEKAHSVAIHLFLQMLDAGRLRDNFTDKEVSFKDAIIILTTNAGKQLYEEWEGGDLSTVSRKVVIKALEKDVDPKTRVPFFPSAICSRFASGNVVMFNQVGAHNLRHIAKMEVQRHGKNLERETGIQMEMDDRVYTALLFAEGGAADARTVRGRAETFFNDELYELFRLVASRKVSTGIAELEKIRVSVDLAGADSGVARFFDPGEKTQVLVLAAPETVEQCRRMLPGMEILGAQTAQDAVETLRNKNLDFAMLDMQFGVAEGELGKLNIEDAASPARDFFKFLRERKNGLPVYVLERQATLTSEEQTSFMRQGVRGVLCLENESFAQQAEQLAVGLYQQASMLRLAREKKLVSFETAQSITEDGKSAQISLFDFKLEVALESEDAKNVLPAVSTPNVRFDDVIGAEDAKAELKYFVEYLKDPKKYIGTGVKAPKGVLLYGPPGTGKTMLAKAMASEAGVTFIAAEGNEFLKKYIGEGSDRVHELFNTARKYAPAVLFIDEIDAIAKERRGESHGAEATLTAFLTEMDGFVSDPTAPVFVLAATNFDVEPGSPKSLDAALMRRFDRRVYIDLPDKQDRIRFLKMKMERNPALEISPEALENIAIRATGMSLAALDSAVELALRSAIRAGSTKVTDAILEEAFETFNSGEVKKWDASQLERVARHEAGHALLYWLAGDTPSYMTVVARGNHGGYMQHAEKEGKNLYTRDEILSLIRTSLGGRAAELVYYGDREGISTGAAGDLASATARAQQLVCSFGMDEEFGLAVVNNPNGELSMELRRTVNRILKEQMAEAVEQISKNKSKIDALVEVLMVKNHLNGEQIGEILENN